MPQMAPSSWIFILVMIIGLFLIVKASMLPSQSTKKHKKIVKMNKKSMLW